MSVNRIFKPAGPVNGKTTNIRSYQHASRIFVDANYRLSPKYGFLFYVEFDFNPLITNVSNTQAQELGMIVKNVNLPKFTMDVKAHNAYNRVNLVQNKIKYDPITITFHDDQADNVRNFWYDYYSFYYRDSDYADDTYQIISKYQERPSFEWGYTPRVVQSYNAANAYQSYQYIQAIRVYSLYQKNFSEYELVNPVITSFRHGEHNQSESGGLLEHQMTVQFETVKYQTGYTTDNTVGGYIDLHYDRTTTPLVDTTDKAKLVDNGSGGFAPAPSKITDLANFNIGTAGGSVMPQVSGGVLSASLGFSMLSSSVLGSSAGAGVNAGGFALPALGTLTSGISSGNFIEQQLKGAAVGLAGQVASTLAGGVISGLTSGLGLSAGAGQSLLGLAASAITNPTATLNAVTNMAVGSVTNMVMQEANSLAAEAAGALSEGIAGAVNTASTAISDAASDAVNYAKDLFSSSSALPDDLYP